MPKPMSIRAVAEPRIARSRQFVFVRLLQTLRYLCPTRVAALVCTLVCVVAPVAIVAVHVGRSPALSVFDEQAHLDYVQRIADGSIPRLGEQLVRTTDELLRCVGHPRWAVRIPACHGATKRALNQYLHSGENPQYEAQQPPLYYAVTAVLRWPMIRLGLAVLAGTRVIGAVWLAAGLLLMWAAARIIGLDWRLTAAGVLLVAAAPNVVLAASSVGNDAAAVFAGGMIAALGAVAWRMPGRLPWWTFALAGLMVALIKVSCALAVVPVSGMLFAANMSGAAGQAKSRLQLLRAMVAAWLPSGGALLAGACIGIVGWAIAFHALALVNPSTYQPIKLDTDGHTGLVDLANQALTMLFPLTSAHHMDYQWTNTSLVPSAGILSTIQSLNADLIAVLLLTVGASTLLTRRRSWAHWLGAGSLLTLFFGGWALGVSILVTYGYNTTLQGRYGLSVAVLMVLALIGWLRGRWGRLLFTVLAVSTFGLSFAYMLA